MGSFHGHQRAFLLAAHGHKLLAIDSQLLWLVRTRPDTLRLNEDKRARRRDEGVWLHHQLVISRPIRRERHVPGQESKIGLFDLTNQDVPSLFGTLGGTHCRTKEVIAGKEIQGHHDFCAQYVFSSAAALPVTGGAFPRDFLEQLPDH
ncbi:UNVERIFIED_ORG: hypothetical protein ABIB19_003987 [Arthrobacter sp. UYEF10]